MTLVKRHRAMLFIVYIKIAEGGGKIVAGIAHHALGRNNLTVRRQEIMKRKTTGLKQVYFLVIRHAIKIINELRARLLFKRQQVRLHANLAYCTWIADVLKL